MWHRFQRKRRTSAAMRHSMCDILSVNRPINQSEQEKLGRCVTKEIRSRHNTQQLVNNSIPAMPYSHIQLFVFVDYNSVCWHLAMDLLIPKGFLFGHIETYFHRVTGRSRALKSFVDSTTFLCECKYTWINVCLYLYVCSATPFVCDLKNCIYFHCFKLYSVCFWIWTMPKIIDHNNNFLVVSLASNKTTIG